MQWWDLKALTERRRRQVPLRLCGLMVDRSTCDVDEPGVGLAPDMGRPAVPLREAREMCYASDGGSPAVSPDIEVEDVRAPCSRARSGALLALVLALSCSTSASADSAIWELSGAAVGLDQRPDGGLVETSRMTFDAAALDAELRAAASSRPTNRDAAEVEIPAPDGRLHAFRVFRTDVLSTSMLARRPDIATFAGRASDGSGRTFRMTTWSGGLSAVVDGGDGWVIEGETRAPRSEARLWWQASDPQTGPADCAVEFMAERRIEEPVPLETAMHGEELRTFRLAVSAPGEFTIHHGSVVDAEAEIVQLVNLANEVFERDLTVRMLLVDVNVYADPTTDPFTNGTAMNNLALVENHDALVAKLGSNGFDLGHVVSQLNEPGWSGLGALEVQCDRSLKGHGGTFARNPSAFALREGVLHEIGHQLGAQHSFNGTAGTCGANRSPTAAYEIASGISIMSYAGTCGSENVVVPRVLMYNAGAMEEIQNAIAGASRCAVAEPSGNQPPVAVAGPDLVVPLETAFLLDGSGSSDPDGDPLKFSWEQFDLGEPSPPYGPGTGPLFRNFPQTPDPVRAFPEYDAYRTGTTVGYEFLPTVARLLTFRLVVRDDNGGTAWDTVALSASGAPFRVLSPNGGETVPAGALASVSWQVGGGDVAAAVRILFSDDAGASWTEVEANTANDGLHEVQIPCSETSQARIRVEPVGHVFYDISDANFTVGPDDTDPVVTCPDPAEFVATSPDGLPQSDPALQQWASGASVIDNCDPNPSLVFAAPSVLPIGTSTVAFFSTDAANNSQLCTTEVTVSLATSTPDLPARTALLGARPNPFNPRTSLHFRLGRRQQLTMEIFDLRGRRIAVLFDGAMEAGEHAIPWDGSGVGSGVYLVRLAAEDGIFHRRIALLK